MTVPIKDLCRSDLRQLADIQLQAIADLCKMLDEQDALVFLECVLTGLIAQGEGYSTRLQTNVGEPLTSCGGHRYANEEGRG
jgi:hypothetical protein